jgi:hypothetical protein
MGAGLAIFFYLTPVMNQNERAAENGHLRRPHLPFRLTVSLLWLLVFVLLLLFL